MAALGAFLSLILRWFLGVFVRLFSLVVNNFLATKIILGTLFIVILPIVINNVIFDLLSTVFTQINSYAGSQASELQSMSFAGLAGYLIDACGLVSAFSIIMSAMIFRFTISWIPFVGPK